MLCISLPPAKDNGFTGSLQAASGEVRTTSELVTIQAAPGEGRRRVVLAVVSWLKVEPVNDMPYLTWITLPPKDGNLDL